MPYLQVRPTGLMVHRLVTGKVVQQPTDTSCPAHDIVIEHIRCTRARSGNLDRLLTHGERRHDPVGFCPVRHSFVVRRERCDEPELSAVAVSAVYSSAHFQPDKPFVDSHSGVWPKVLLLRLQLTGVAHIEQRLAALTEVVLAPGGDLLA